MILTVLLFAVFILAIQLIIQYPFCSDTFGKYLPWARIIANEQGIPAFHLHDNPRYVMSVVPLLYTHISLIFSLIGVSVESLSVGVPLFFSTATIFLVYTWSKEYNDKGVPLFAMLALITSILFLTSSPVVLQEAPVLFFATASFYLFFKYIKTRDNLHLILLSAASALLILTKEAGLVIATLIFFGLLVKSKSKKEVKHVSIVFILLNSLSLIWMIRNFYYFENPVFPMLANMFGGELAQYKAVSMPIIEPVQRYFRLQQFIRGVITSFPAILFAFIYLFKNIKKFESQFVILNLVLLVILINVATTGIVRYIYPLLGVFAVFAAIEMSKAYDWILPKNMIKHKKQIVNLLIIILMITFVAIVHVNFVNLYAYKNGFGDQNEILCYLQQHEGRKDVRIFGDDIPIVLTWYGNYTGMRRFDLPFRVLNKGKIFYINETSDYYYTVFKKTGIDYVYGTYGLNRLNTMFSEINKDKEHFELIFNGSERRLWKVK
jgi:hypothetical protein